MTIDWNQLILQAPGLAVSLYMLYFVMKKWVEREKEWGTEKAAGEKRIADELLRLLSDCKMDKTILIETLQANTLALTELKDAIKQNGVKKQP